MEDFSLIRNLIIEQDAEDTDIRKNQIKEVLQEVILYALSKTDFFHHAAFLGGTALRIFYDLPRFSEDLDFSLFLPDADFSLEAYTKSIEETFDSFGLQVSVHEKKKHNAVKSAFLKSQTRELLLQFFPDKKNAALGVHPGELVKIKLEVDTNPPAGAGIESKYRFRPMPHRIQIYDEPSLFAGKLHAILCRPWTEFSKGRDLYDFIFYIQRGTKYNLNFLREALIQTKAWNPEQPLKDKDVIEMIKDKFRLIDYEKAKKDVLPFLQNNSDQLSLWSPELFCQAADLLKSSDA